MKNQEIPIPVILHSDDYVIIKKDGDFAKLNNEQVIIYGDYEEGLNELGTDEKLVSCLDLTDEYKKLLKENIRKYTYKIDAINNPQHYNSGKIEVIDFIEDQSLNFNLGNVIKYVSRAGKKDPEKYKEDLEKAKWYLEREIKKLKKYDNKTKIQSSSKSY